MNRIPARSISTEKISTGDEDGSQFYADKGFSIAVDYDTTRTAYVAIVFTTNYGSKEYAPLQPGRLYSFDMKNAAEYEIYGVLKENATDISPLEVRFYTEGVPTTDSNGMVFAVVAILLCALAFGTLFYSGLHPKWGEDAGLPDGSEDVPGISEASEETVAADAEPVVEENETKDE